MTVSTELERSISRKKWFGAQMILSPAIETGGESRQILWRQEAFVIQALPFFMRAVIVPIGFLKDLVRVSLSAKVVTFRPLLYTETNLPAERSDAVFLNEITVKQDESA